MIILQKCNYFVEIVKFQNITTPRITGVKLLNVEPDTNIWIVTKYIINFHVLLIKFLFKKKFNSTPTIAPNFRHNPKTRFKQSRHSNHITELKPRTINTLPLDSTNGLSRSEWPPQNHRDASGLT